MNVNITYNDTIKIFDLIVNVLEKNNDIVKR